MDILALIPARSGSKGVPHKNIKELKGKPLIAYTIEAAKKSKYLKNENIICSTNSNKIAEIAKSFGANVPFLRPERYAKDESSSISVAIHAINHMKKSLKKEYEYIMLLQPTSPLRKPEHIDESIKMIEKDNKWDSVISISTPQNLPYNMKMIDKKGLLKDFIRNDYQRRQEMPEVYCTNGAIYLTKIETVLEENSFFGDSSKGYIMQKEFSIDIDDKFDWKICELLL